MDNPETEEGTGDPWARWAPWISGAVVGVAAIIGLGAWLIGLAGDEEFVASAPATSTTVADIDPADVREWRRIHGGFLDDISDALGGISQAADRSDVGRMRLACAELSAAADAGFRADPVPVPRAAWHIDRSLDLLDEAGTLCVDGLGIDGDLADVERSAVLLVEGGDAAEKATAEIERVMDP